MAYREKFLSGSALIALLLTGIFRCYIPVSRCEVQFHNFETRRSPLVQIQMTASHGLLFSCSSDLALYLEDYFMDLCDTWNIGSV